MIAHFFITLNEVWRWGLTAFVVIWVGWTLCSCADTKHVGDSTDWGTASKEIGREVNHD